MLRLEIERNRDALLAAAIGAPQTLPAPSELDFEALWTRFEADAPAHLRLGFEAAALLIGVLLPRLLGCGGSFIDLDEDTRDAVLQRAVELPVFGDLAEVLKIVACLGYFDDEAVQAQARAVDSGRART